MDDETKRRADFLGWVDEAKSSGKKLGWAAYQYKDAYGDWPPKAWSMEAGTMPARPPGSPVVASKPAWDGQGACPTCGHAKAAQAAPKKDAAHGAYPPPPSDLRF